MAQTLQKITTLKERRLRWLTALESARFKQGESSLKTPFGGYCCLGVACAISGVGYFNKYDEFVNGKDNISNEDLWNLPKIRKLLNISNTQHELAMCLNDGGCISYKNITYNKIHTFKEIATIFRKIWRLPKS